MSSALPIVTVEEMVEYERGVIDGGVSADTLMTQAGGRLAQVITAQVRQRLGSGCRPSVLLLVGKGNNGGDGLVIAHHLAEIFPVTVFLAFGRDSLGDLPRAKLSELEAQADEGNVSTALGAVSRSLAIIDGQTTPLGPQHFPQVDGVVVDALLGIGTRGALRAPLDGIASLTNRMRRERYLHVVAVDAPTGLLGAESGSSSCIEAETTLTIGFPKEPLTRETTADFVGQFGVIRLFEDCPPPTTKPSRVLLSASWLAPLLPRRKPSSHKGTFGRALIIGGSHGFLGAPLLAGQAALRAGTGLLTIAVPPDLADLAMGRAPSAAMIAERRANQEFGQRVAQASSIAIGPGLGLGKEAAQMVKFVLSEARCPVVLDADALTILAEHPRWLKHAIAPVILTPHPGEMARLCGGLRVEPAEREAVAQGFAREHGVVVVLKGCRTVVAARGAPLAINSTGNPGLATGGSGDTLTGIVTALLAQGLVPVDAARLGVWLHGKAADLALARSGTEESILPDDVAAHLGEALLALRRHAALPLW